MKLRGTLGKGVGSAATPSRRSEPVVQLYVAYKDGGVYRFPRVTYETYERLCRAESIGKALHLLFPGEDAGERVGDVSRLLKGGE